MTHSYNASSLIKHTCSNLQFADFYLMTYLSRGGYKTEESRSTKYKNESNSLQLLNGL